MNIVRVQDDTSKSRIVKSILKNSNVKYYEYPESVLKVSKIIQDVKKQCKPELEIGLQRTGLSAEGRSSLPTSYSPDSLSSRSSPPSTPTSPSLACEHHSCGSLFAGCAVHGRTQLLETFTDTSSSLFRNTFTRRSECTYDSLPYYRHPIMKTNSLDLPSKTNGFKAPEESQRVVIEREIEISPVKKTINLLRRHNSLPENRIPEETLTDLLEVCPDNVSVSLAEVLKEKSPEKQFKIRRNSENMFKGKNKRFTKEKRCATPVVDFEHPEIVVRSKSNDEQERNNEEQDEDVQFKEESSFKFSTDRVVEELLKGNTENGNVHPHNTADVLEYLKCLVGRLKKEAKSWEEKADSLEAEWLVLKRELKKRDEENVKLRTENHKLRSVLLQKKLSEQKDLLSSLQDSHAMSGQSPHVVVTAVPSKKQGVSGESSDVAKSIEHNDIQRYEKDFRSRQVIKDAVMDNDFLENLDAGQIREVVDCMYLKEYSKGDYVLLEGGAGAHLYVSAEGQLEVIKEGKVLGRMGPGKAFGELAILYNCKRTASIKVVSEDAKVWALDRRVFQQIMMHSVKQRLQEKINFLRSVPLLHKLSNEHLSKMADVLELEFYPTGAHIIHQGGVGDTFFIISEGQVKVTQRTAGRREEEEIRILGKGDYFGEQALLKEEHRTASIIALSPGVECLTLARDAFIQLIGDLSELHEKTYGDENRVLSRPASAVNINNTEEYDYVTLENLDVIATLGVGGFGRVELVQYMYERSLTFALKCLKKQHIVDTQQQAHVLSERKIMMSCNSPFICRLYKTFRDHKYVFMLLEACLGGEVWTILRDKGCFDDLTSKFVTACVVEAFEYLHARGIIYRDLKPENLLLDEQGYVKIVDMGFSKVIGFNNKTWTFCGTPEYVAPEIILNKGHDRAVDYWALGVLMHELLTGKPPFSAPDPMKTYIMVLKGVDIIKFPKNVTRTSQHLIKQLCRDSPTERLGYQRGGIQDIKTHKWFSGFDWEALKNRTLLAPIIPKITSPTDTSNFDSYPKVLDMAPEEFSDWDVDFESRF